MSLRSSVIRSSLCLKKVQRVKAGSNLEFVRFRKPRFETRAASKLYRVAKREPMKEDEYELMMEWTRKYNTDMKSLKTYLINYTMKMGTTAVLKAQRLDFKEVEEKNGNFNSESRRIREAAQKELHKTQKLINEKIAQRDFREKEEMRRRAQERVTKEQETFGDFVLPDNMDDKIERLLNTRSDPNYAINKFGRIMSKDGNVTDQTSASSNTEKVPEKTE